MLAPSTALSYYGAPTLALRLRLQPEELVAARAQLVGLDLIAYEAPLYQVLGLPGVGACTQARAARSAPAVPVPPLARDTSGPVSLGDLLSALERRRARL